MKILLLGEYSNVHWTLAEGLRALSHEVTVASNGDFWKDYPRDIDLSRVPGKVGGIRLLLKIWHLLPQLTGYDVVQIINPMFLELKAEHIFPIYKFLRKRNRRLVLGAYGMDYYWVHENITRMPLRYSDFNIGNLLRTNTDALKERRDWIGTAKEKLNKYIAADCDAIVTGLYEYHVCYQPHFPNKTTFIPYPIKLRHDVSLPRHTVTAPIRIFIGISKNRSEYKGTDIMLAAAKAIKEQYTDRVQLRIAEGVPFNTYIKMMNDADLILDQLYSYTPSMNPLEAMSRGVVCVGGGEPENYEILGEHQLRPIINVEPTYESVYHRLEQLVLHPERIPMLQQQSVEYIRRHHNYIKVAQQYADLYRQLL